jgi:putative transposase
MKRRRLGTSTVPACRLSAERSNHVWALDFIFDATSDGRPIKALSMCDEFTRENLARRLGRSITADEVIHALDDACVVRGAPEFIRGDNGPEFVAMAIRDWCREHGTSTAYIEPGSPWQTPYVESFNGKLRDELFSREVFDTIMEARLLFDDWCDTYNRHRPHSALGYLPPAVFAAAFNQPELSYAVDHPPILQARMSYSAMLTFDPQGMAHSYQCRVLDELGRLPGRAGSGRMAIGNPQGLRNEQAGRSRRCDCWRRAHPAQVEVQAIRAGAVNQAIKAIAISRGYVAPGGLDLVCIPSFINISIDGESGPASAWSSKCASVLSQRCAYKGERCLPGAHRLT